MGETEQQSVEQVAIVLGHSQKGKGNASSLNTPPHDREGPECFMAHL